jgi:hypothetical protein
METSKIKIRPFIPCMKDEEKDGREEFATLKYGNVEIQIDQTILEYLTLNSQSDLMIKTTSIFRAGVAEMKREMWTKLENKLPPHHRDSGSLYVKDFAYNPLHVMNKEIEIL